MNESKFQIFEKLPNNRPVQFWLPETLTKQNKQETEGQRENAGQETPDEIGTRCGWNVSYWLSFQDIIPYAEYVIVSKQSSSLTYSVFFVCTVPKETYTWSDTFQSIILNLRYSQTLWGEKGGPSATHTKQHSVSRACTRRPHKHWTS